MRSLGFLTAKTADTAKVRPVDGLALIRSAAPVDGLAPIRMPPSESVLLPIGCKTVTESSNRFAAFADEATSAEKD